MKTKYIILMIVMLISLSGCMFSPYANPKFGGMAIDAWFSDKDLGQIRKNIELIDEIVDKSCTYVESRNNKYVFKCEITYKEKGETVIPLSKHSKKKVYVVFIKKSGNKYDSKVYNSSSPNNVWRTDEYLEY